MGTEIPPNSLRLRGARASLVAQTVKCLPTMWETRVQSLAQEDPLEKAMATHSSVFFFFYCSGFCHTLK